MAKINISTDSCDNFVHEDCFYPVPIYSKHGSVADARHCQEECETLAPMCQYWVFQPNQFSSDGSTHCHMYSGFDVAHGCAAVNGPQYPHREDCVRGNNSEENNVTKLYRPPK